jgi:hypothetical protein
LSDNETNLGFYDVASGSQAPGHARHYLFDLRCLFLWWQLSNIELAERILIAMSICGAGQGSIALTRSFFATFPRYEDKVGERRNAVAKYKYYPAQSEFKKCPEKKRSMNQ